MGVLLESARLQRVLQGLLEGDLVCLLLLKNPWGWWQNVVVNVDAAAALLLVL